MDVGTVVSVAQAMFIALQSPELGSILGFKSDLINLQRTISTVNAVLLDADTRPVLAQEAQLYIEELKDAVYDADDLLDEFVTLAEQKHLIMGGGKFSKKVRLFFSRFNQLILGYNMSQGVKFVRNKLDAIASNHSKFGFKHDYDQTSNRRREETCSHVYAGDIIGREADLENIVRVLLDPDVERDVSFLTVMGIGGLGKTALAQLIFNDERVSSAFSLKLWTCVFDQDQERLNFTEILSKILESATGGKHLGSTLDLVQKRLQAQLAEKRFFLVLDDVWNENRDEWIKLAGFLTGGRRGSWILVTTRSRETARVIGNGLTYELLGLSKEDSWRLFEKMAVEQGTLSGEFIQIGQEIVKGCANVPLAIRVVGSLLYGQRKAKWVSFKQRGMANVRRAENNGIMPILKLSYHHLKSPLRSCFSYCALFPKDFEIDKEMLIGLWMAQGYITPSERGQRIEDVAEDYFFTLLRRCFFQDVKKDEYGEIISCKVHDLLHDIAQEVSAKEIFEVNSNTVKVSKVARHLAVRGNKFMENSSSMRHIRTFLQVGKVGDMLLTENLIANCPCLRTLDLRGADFENLSNSIGKLLHLRYLDLSYNEKLKVLPKSITNLHNLQTLNLVGCRGLKVLPKDMSKLVKLRIFDVKDCFLPLYMPLNFGKLTCLQKLDRFSMGDLNPSGKQRFDQLKDLKALINLKGSLGLQILACQSAPYYATGGAYMSTLEHLTGIEIWYIHRTDSYTNAYYEEAILEDLQPHPNLRYIRLVEYNGLRMPSWAGEHNLATFLPNLVRIEFKECLGLHHLPWFEILRHLKFLRLEILPNLKYLTNGVPAVDLVPGSSEGVLSLFPCLEYLYLEDLPKLKGWWPRSKAGDDDADGSSLCLPQLKGLWIYECPEMKSIPLSPCVDDLRIYDANRSLELKTLDRERYQKGQLSSPTASDSSTHPKETRLTTGNVELLRLVPVGNFQCLKEMRIESDYKLKSFSEVEDLFKSCLSSLQFLEIWRCPKLASLSGGLEHLTALEKLHIRKTHSLRINDVPTEAEDTVIPWRGLAQTLHSLKLEDLPQLLNLPTGLQHLPCIRSLSIVDCQGLQTLPKWMPELVSLAKLEVSRCSTELTARCRNPSGAHWVDIQHIRDILLDE